MNTVIVISGGIGRVLCAIPALEKFVLENKEHSVSIVVYGWLDVFHGNRVLQNITYEIGHKNIFNLVFKNADTVITPEPYLLPEYYSQKISLVQAFDKILNNSTNSDIPRICLHPIEEIEGRKIVENIQKENSKDKTIVIQPFGRSAYYDSAYDQDFVLDDTSRSLNLQTYSSIVKSLSKSYNIVLMADEHLQFKEDTFTVKINTSLRNMAAIIKASDYFIGCDSLGQHLARAFNKPGTIIFGSTFPENVSYPDWFNIVDYDKNSRVYSPIRISDYDSKLANWDNSTCMSPTDKEIDNTIQSIQKHLKVSI